MARNKKVIDMTLEDYGKLRQLLENRTKEIFVCLENKAYMASILLIGSTAEGVLYFVASHFSKFKKNTECKLYDLINWAKNINAISESTSTKLLELKDIRNYIHINLEMENGIEITEDVVNKNIEILTKLVYEVLDFVSKKVGSNTNATK